MADGQCGWVIGQDDAVKVLVHHFDESVEAGRVASMWRAQGMKACLTDDVLRLRAEMMGPGGVRWVTRRGVIWFFAVCIAAAAVLATLHPPFAAWMFEFLTGMWEAIIAGLIQMMIGTVMLVSWGPLIAICLLSLVLVVPLSISWMRRIQKQREAGEVNTGAVCVIFMMLLMAFYYGGGFLPRLVSRDHTVVVFLSED